jgi:hypothetical protein
VVTMGAHADTDVQRQCAWVIGQLACGGGDVPQQDSSAYDSRRPCAVIALLSLRVLQ